MPILISYVSASRGGMDMRKGFLIKSFKGFSKNAKLYLYAFAFYSIASGAFSMLQGIYIKELKLGEDFLGLLMGSKTIAIAVFAFPCALVVNRLGKKRALFISMLIVPLSILFQGILKNMWAIYFLSIFQGIFEALLGVTASPFLMDNSHDDERITLFSFSFATNTFSMMFGYYLSGNVVESLKKSFDIISSYRYTIMLAGIIGLIALMFIILMKKSNENEIKNEFVSLKQAIMVFKEKGVYQFIIYNSLIGFGAGLVVPYFNVYLKYKISITDVQLGTIMSISQIATGIGGLLTPLLARRFGKVKTIIMCQIASIPFLLLIATPPSILLVSIAFFMRSALMNMTGPVINNISMELVDSSRRSVLSSIFNLSANLSRALSIMAAGFIMKNFERGYEIPYYITTILYIIGTIYFYKTFKNFDSKKRHMAHER